MGTASSIVAVYLDHPIILYVRLNTISATTEKMPKIVMVFEFSEESRAAMVLITAKTAVLNRKMKGKVTAK